MRSKVASGPIPPMIPTTRCIVAKSGCFGLARAAESEVIDIAKQARAATRVDEHDVLPFFEGPQADQIDEARHAFAGVNGIEQDAFEAREHLDGIEGSGRGETVSL